MLLKRDDNDITFHVLLVVLELSILCFVYSCLSLSFVGFLSSLGGYKSNPFPHLVP